jgi:hypothetical protein
MLQDSDIAACIMEAANLWGHKSPFDTINKLHIICFKARTRDNIFWVIESVVHYSKAGLMDNCAVSGRMWKGFGNNKGLVELLVCKNTLRASLLLKWVLWHCLNKIKSQIGTVLKSAASYRSHMYGEGLMWQGKLNPHSLRFFELMEAIA